LENNIVRTQFKRHAVPARAALLAASVLALPGN
jgi:hypothetical protein